MHVRTVIKVDYATRNPNEACAQTHAWGVLEHVSWKRRHHTSKEGEDTRYDHIVAEYGCDKKLALASRGDKTTLSLREQRATNVFWLRSDFKARVAARVVLDEKLYIQQN